MEETELLSFVEETESELKPLDFLGSKSHFLYMLLPFSLLREANHEFLS